MPQQWRIIYTSRLNLAMQWYTTELGPLSKNDCLNLCVSLGPYHNHHNHNVHLGGREYNQHAEEGHG